MHCAKRNLSRPGGRIRAALTVGALALTSACAVGPDYVKPTIQAPVTFKETDGWKIAQPQDDVLRGDWWQIFRDAQLSALEEQVDRANLTLVAAEARYRQATAMVQGARASYFPTVSVGFGVTGSGGGSKSAAANFSLPFNVSWEPDLWGRIRRTVEANQANAQASAADLQTTRLSIQAQLAESYFQLRSLDTQKALMDRTVADYEKSLELTKNRYNAGIVSRADILQAETQLKTTKTQAIDLGVQRAQLEHAIAILIGKAPAELTLAAAPLDLAPPAIPVSVPSAILERRPDIAVAERLVASANAQIGVAKAAFFPQIVLSASAGFQGSAASNLLSAASGFWSVGPTLAQNLFDGGLRRAQSKAAWAAYDETVAGYRQTALVALQEVEDNLAALRVMDEEAAMQDEAVKAARETVALTTNRYEAGLASYLDVIVAQTAALANERSAAQLLGRRMTASVLLIKALGGGWEPSKMPTITQVNAGTRL